MSDLSRENDWFEWYQELFEILDETNEIDRLIESLLGLVGDVDGDQRLEVLERLVRAHQKNDDFEKIVAKRTCFKLRLSFNELYFACFQAHYSCALLRCFQKRHFSSVMDFFKMHIKCFENSSYLHLSYVSIGNQIGISEKS